MAGRNGVGLARADGRLGVSGVAVRLSASTGGNPEGDPGSRTVDGDLYATSIAWPLFANASREADGWYLTIKGGGEIFLPALPAAALTPGSTA